MEKSIEDIWKEGFLKNNDLTVPKINDLYNRKSQHIIDKFKRYFSINLIAIVVFALLVLITAILGGTPFIGFSIFSLLILIVFIGKRKLETLQQIDKGLNSYQYLQTFDQWLKDMLSLYKKLYRFLYPLFFLLFFWGTFFSVLDQATIQKLAAKSSQAFYTFRGVPVSWILGSLLFAGLIVLFSGVIYRFDIHLIYGRQLKKLDEILADMEELRRE